MTQRRESGKIVFANQNPRVLARRERANERKVIREQRTNQEQIQHILARGGDPMCKEILRLGGLNEDLTNR